MLTSLHQRLIAVALAVSFLATSVLFSITDNYLWFALPFAFLLIYQSWSNPKWLYFLLLAMIPFSMELMVTETVGTDFPDEPLMWLLSFITIVLLTHRNGVEIKKLFRQPVFIVLICLFCWSLLTAVFSVNKIVSIKYLLSKGWYILAFVIAPVLLIRNKTDLRKADMILVGSLTVVVLVIQLRHFQNGFTFAMINDAVYPFFRNHVNYAALLVCIIPVSIALALTSRNHQNKIVFVLISVVLLFALYFSYSRGAWLALLAGLLAWWLIKKRLLLITFITAVIISLLLFFWIKSEDRYLEYAHDFKTTIFHENFSEHLVSTYQLKDLSTAERFYRWIAGVRMIKDNWLTGTGPATFYPAYKSYAIPAYKTWVSDNPERSTVHNYFLLAAVEQGIPGLIFLLILLALMLYYAEKRYHQSKGNNTAAIYLVIGIISVMIIVLNSLSDLIETDKIGSIFYLCISLLLIDWDGK